jgi:hypothetical protein
MTKWIGYMFDLNGCLARRQMGKRRTRFSKRDTSISASFRSVGGYLESAILEYGQKHLELR